MPDGISRLNSTNTNNANIQPTKPSQNDSTISAAQKIKITSDKSKKVISGRAIPIILFPFFVLNTLP